MTDPDRRLGWCKSDLSDETSEERECENSDLATLRDLLRMDSDAALLLGGFACLSEKGFDRLLLCVFEPEPEETVSWDLEVVVVLPLLCELVRRSAGFVLGPGVGDGDLSTFCAGV